MSTKSRIKRAYCVQLDEVVSITQSRQAFFSLPEPRRSFEFLCSNKSCLDQPIKAEITAVNYDKHPNDTYRAAHFRENDRYSHAPGCEWVIDEDVDEVNGKLPGETDEEAFVRRARRKLHDYIDVFDPNPERDTDAGTPGSTAGGGEEDTSGTRGKGSRQGGKASGNHSTTDLERLVECYIQARLKLSDEEFKAMRLKVVGQSEMPLRKAAWQLRRKLVAVAGALRGDQSLRSRLGYHGENLERDLRGWIVDTSIELDGQSIDGYRVVSREALEVIL
ncbi:hypothetical protein HBO32_31580 [Pseudomonas nitroreducens]|nr:hypothetical protein [Pseudomonas nitroreducens]NMZ77643.1 hypothetical protein [Pseudomonas nitroreducens]